MNKTTKAVLICFSILNCSILPAQSVNARDYVPAELYAELSLNGNIRKINETGNNDYTLVPYCAFKNDCETHRVEKNDGNFPFVAEMIYKISKEELRKTNKTSKKDYGMKDVSRIARSVSTMEGMKYYSSLRRKRITLYKNAYMLESLENPVPVKDRLSGTADGLECYAFLEDASFGPCNYKLVYRENENSLYARFTNVDSMGLGFVRGIQPGNLIINMIIIDCDDSFIIYLGTDADCIKFPGIRASIEDSLISRLDAIYDWFIHQFK